MVKILEAVKWIVFVALIALAVMVLFGGKPSETPFDAMESKVTVVINKENLLEGDNMTVKQLYGLDPANYEGVKLLYPTTNMGAEELLLIKLKEAAQEKDVLDAIDARIAVQKNSFDGYGIEQMGLLEKCLVLSKGNYVIFSVAENNDEIKQVFQDAL